LTSPRKNSWVGLCCEVYKERDIIEVFLCCEPLELRKEWINLTASNPPSPMKHLSRLVGSVCTDGVLDIGKNSGFIYVKKIGQDIMQCCHPLVTKTLPCNFKNSLSVVKIVNYASFMLPVHK
jgi:hypothetical protein